MKFSRPSADHLIGAALALAYITLLLATADNLAMSRDESFYVEAAEQYAGWFRMLIAEPQRALQRNAIDAAWGNNHEHPALMKSLFAWSWLVQQRFHWFAGEMSAHRFPAMLLAGLGLWLIYLFGSRAFERRVGVFAALAFALLPRPFYHAHLNCFDLPIAILLLAVTYAYWRSLQERRWAILVGLLYGLALATKHNAWLLPAILAIHWGWWRSMLPATQRPRTPWWLLAMLGIGPLIFVGSWPWLWHDTAARFVAYARFHLHHVHYDIAYLGTTYFQPPFPISYPFVMTAMTVPATILLLTGIGLAVRGARVMRRQADGRQTDVLLLGTLLAPLLLIALPWTPIFGGTKHWFAAYPALALFAGLGFAWSADRLRLARPAAACFGAWLLVPAAVETAHSHRFGLSHYGVLAGGVPGAASLGMNRQFWGFTTGSLAPWLRAHLPHGGRVWPCDTTWGAWHMMQRDGMLPPSIQATDTMSEADYVLVHHEDHFIETETQVWQAFGSVQPAHVLTYDGVPIVSVYENPRHRARRALAQP